VDFETACGTPIHAIADGVVEVVDNSTFGAAPHNLVISHIDAGVASVYGHLLERSPMLPSQPIKRGDVIGKTGDPDLTCRSRPHLHLEIRSLDYRFAYNPVQYIEADWDMLATLGEQIGVTFAKNLYAPNQWQTLESQPKTALSGNTINSFEQTWPPPLAFRRSPSPSRNFVHRSLIPTRKFS
jgi:murein DD-endopeptidase MepM/ murein hydrolase activator NlpD